MATYSSNTTIRISATPSGAATRSVAGVATVYTAPANGYAVLNCLIQIAASTPATIGQIYANGQPVGQIQNSQTVTFSNVYVGPGSTLGIYANGGGANVALFFGGVEFINSP